MFVRKQYGRKPCGKHQPHEEAGEDAEREEEEEFRLPWLNIISLKQSVLMSWFLLF